MHILKTKVDIITKPKIYYFFNYYTIYIWPLLNILSFRLILKTPLITLLIDKAWYNEITFQEKLLSLSCELKYRKWNRLLEITFHNLQKIFSASDVGILICKCVRLLSIVKSIVLSHNILKLKTTYELFVEKKGNESKSINFFLFI